MFFVYHVGNNGSYDHRFHDGYYFCRSPCPERWFEERGFEFVKDGFPTEAAAVKFMQENGLPMYRGTRSCDHDYDPDDSASW